MSDCGIVEHVTFEEVQRAYFDCRKHKRGKDSALQYELNYEENNYFLYQSLNEGTYEIGESICFCVTWPKLREVFAADFRDRIVHHLLMNKFLRYFESDFIDATYSCREGKGVFYGVHDIERQIKDIGHECWYVKVDISGFFMSIDKDVLWRKVERLIRSKWDYEGEDIEWWLHLFKQVIYHRPELKCRKQGDLTLWDLLPHNKSLFYSNGKGLPIGNLTSQILANFYLSDIDHWLSDSVKGYGRYVDDLVLLDTDRNFLKSFIPKIREEFRKLGVVLNEKKTIIQRADKGLLFTGYVIKPWGVYAGNRLRNAALKVSYYCLESTGKHIMRINSYLGFLRHFLTYNIRERIWQNVLTRYHGLYAKLHLYSIHPLLKTQRKG